MKDIQYTEIEKGNQSISPPDPFHFPFFRPPLPTLPPAHSSTRAMSSSSMSGRDGKARRRFARGILAWEGRDVVGRDVRFT